MAEISFTYLNGPDIAALDMTDEEILGAVEAGLRAQGRGETVIEPRMHLKPGLSDGWFNVLRGVVHGHAGVKVVGDFVDNYKSGLPSEMALLNLFDPVNGTPRAIIDAAGITDMRTGAVTAIGALYGPRLGAGTVLAWLALGAIGVPVFASGAGGVEHLRGATAGYLWAFPVAAGVTGWLVARGWNAGRKAWAFAAMLIGNLICLTLGASWLAVQIGLMRAIEAGFLPFLIGAGVKAGLGVGVLLIVQKLSASRTSAES